MNINATTYQMNTAAENQRLGIGNQHSLLLDGHVTVHKLSRNKINCTYYNHITWLRRQTFSNT